MQSLGLKTIDQVRDAMIARCVLLALGLALGLLAHAANAGAFEARAADTPASADSGAAAAAPQDPVRYERWDPAGDRLRQDAARTQRDSLAFEKRVRGAEHRASLVTNGLMLGGAGLVVLAAGASGEPGAAAIGLAPLIGAGLVGPAAGWSYGGDGRQALKSIAAHTVYLIGPTVVMVAITDPKRWREPENVDVVFPTLLASFIVNTVLAYHENRTIEPTLRREAAGPQAAVVPAVTEQGAPALALQLRW